MTASVALASVPGEMAASSPSLAGPDPAALLQALFPSPGGPQAGFPELLDGLLGNDAAPGGKVAEEDSEKQKSEATPGVNQALLAAPVPVASPLAPAKFTARLSFDLAAGSVPASVPDRAGAEQRPTMGASLEPVAAVAVGPAAKSDPSLQVQGGPREPSSERRPAEPFQPASPDIVPPSTDQAGADRPAERDRTVISAPSVRERIGGQAAAPARVEGPDQPAMLAFAARLIPVAGTAEKTSRAAAPATPRPEPVLAAIPPNSGPVLHVSPLREDRQFHSADDAGPAHPRGAAEANPAASQASFPIAPPRGSSNPGDGSTATPTARLLAAERSTAAEPTLASPTPATHPAARDIRLQVGGPDRHVDVRLTERGGEVRVAVRTPDSRLAGALRDDLPGLSARLEQTGFRTETWHPAASGLEQRLQAAQTQPSDAAASGQQMGRQGSRDEQQQQRQDHQPPVPEAETASDSPPKEFSWLFSSLR